MEFYEVRAIEFSKTRGYIWPCVKHYLDKNTNKNNSLIELGCGNGKNLKYAINNGYNIDNTIGIDNSNSLINICNKSGLNVILGDICNLDFINRQFDNVLCIAVLHHLTTNKLRQLALHNLYKLCKKGGTILITVWSYECEWNGIESHYKRKLIPGDNIIYWKHQDERYYYIYSIEMLITFIENAKQQLDFNYTLEWEEQNWVITIFKITK
jgi:alkylated DNA repair protein alkB family protein 8